MKIPIVAFTFIAILASGNVYDLFGENRMAGKVLTCDAITLARPGEGVAYKDRVTNDDYHFSATIPAGQTAWGASPDAPFHGFTIFLDRKSSEGSCIVLMVGMRVDLPEDLSANSKPEGRAVVKIGNRVGLRELTRGIVHGVAFENVRMSLELPRSGYNNAVTITLVTPIREKRATVPVFGKFISQIRFW